MLCIAGIVLVTACSKPFSEAIVGKWEDTQTSDRMEFLPDHTFNITSHGRGVSGKWTKVDNTRFKLDMVMQGNPGFIMMEDVTISGDEMKATLAGTPGTARRVK